MDLGARIQTILKERNLKQVEFAKAMGISANYVNLLVNHKKTRISETLAKLIEETYGYAARWVMEGTGDKLAGGRLRQQGGNFKKDSANVRRGGQGRHGLCAEPGERACGFSGGGRLNPGAMEDIKRARSRRKAGTGLFLML